MPSARDVCGEEEKMRRGCTARKRSGDYVQREGAGAEDSVVERRGLQIQHWKFVELD